jgi:hypothetical protein
MALTDQRHFVEFFFNALVENVALYAAILSLGELFQS